MVFNSIISAYHSFRKFEDGFSSEPWVYWTNDHAEIPVFAVSLYLLMVFQMPSMLDPKTRPKNLRYIIAAWNGLLAVFSIIGFSRLGPALFGMLWNDGFHYSVCGDVRGKPEATGGPALWMTLFIYSKTPELVDTLFLILARKKVIFLHWFHHTTVLLYCWHAFQNAVSPGVWFATMNYGVHSVMYAYYCAMAFRFRKIASHLAPIITILQISQMVAGSYVTGYTAQVHSSGQPCFVTPSNYKLGLAMYVSYFALFCMLFYQKYLAPQPKPAALKVATANGKSNGHSSAHANGNGSLHDFAKHTDAGGLFRTDSFSSDVMTPTTPTKDSPKNKDL